MNVRADTARAEALPLGAVLRQSFLLLWRHRTGLIVCAIIPVCFLVALRFALSAFWTATIGEGPFKPGDLEVGWVAPVLSNLAQALRFLVIGAFMAAWLRLLLGRSSSGPFAFLYPDRAVLGCWVIGLALVFTHGVLWTLLSYFAQEGANYLVSVVPPWSWELRVVWEVHQSSIFGTDLLCWFVLLPFALGYVRLVRGRWQGWRTTFALGEGSWWRKGFVLLGLMATFELVAMVLSYHSALMRFSATGWVEVGIDVLSAVVLTLLTVCKWAAVATGAYVVDSHLHKGKGAPS